MTTYHGYLEAYWEQGWEGRIEYALAIEGESHPFFLTTGQHLTIYAADGGVLWQGRLRFVGRGREQHDLRSGIWADVKQEGVPYGQWIAWFVHQPPLRATLETEPPEELATNSPLLPRATKAPATCLGLIGRGALLGALAGAGLASLSKLLASLACC